MFLDHACRVSVTEHHTDIKEDASPQQSQPYRGGLHARQGVHSSIDEILAQDTIKPERSEWEAPVVLITKPNGKLRFYGDYVRSIVQLTRSGTLSHGWKTAEQPRRRQVLLLT